jgi:hypothetical protein
MQELTDYIKRPNLSIKGEEVQHKGFLIYSTK